MSDAQRTLVIQNLNSGKLTRFEHIQEYMINRAESSLLLSSTKDSLARELLLWIDMGSSKSKKIYTGPKSSNYIFDATGKSLSFIVDYQGLKNIYYYKNGTDSAKLLANDSSPGIDTKLKISTNEIWSFNKKGDGLFFTLTEKIESKIDNDNEPEIWNYQDQILYTAYKINGNKTNIGKGRNLTFLNIKNKEIKQLLTSSQRLAPGGRFANGNALVIESSDLANKRLPSYDDTHRSYYVYYIDSNTIVPLKINSKLPLENIIVSPDDKFIIYYDYDMKNFVSFNIATRASENITQSIRQLKRYQATTRSLILPVGIVRWMSKGHKVIIQGTYDLWEVDLSNKTMPIQLTHQIDSGKPLVFSFCSSGQLEELDIHKNYYIKGFDLDTKETSIYVLNIASNRFLRLYCCNHYVSDLYNPIAATRFMKAEFKNDFLLKFEKVNESPNYVYTKDFKIFTDISYVHPEKDYNWLRSELLTYKDSLGQICKGVLYKPDNFDPSKKYPVLFVIYAEQGHRVNFFLNSDPSNIGVNIPLLVSNGYLVFKPDMYIGKQKFGESVLLSVMAGVDALARYAWVDTSRMCLSGHSFGGWEANIIISQTNKFKAAIVAAGPTNTINLYNDLWDDGNDFHGYVGGTMGGRLEELTDLYVKTSPILHLNNLETPILLVHNKKDNAAPFYQSSQMFVQLRSMQKKVWLLTYPGEMHTVEELKFQLDLQNKIKNYLDYYLKNAPEPIWMSKHIMLN
jgi:dipeptidyl aminopeptidase/acylaminoacyl peptidase